jgi:hypothetical protein
LSLAVIAGIPLAAGGSSTASEDVLALYLHGTGPAANPPDLFLDEDAPASTTAKYRDSGPVNFNNGNSWKGAGSWPSGTDFGNAQALTAWLGLVNSDDQGTRFDLLAEVFKEGDLVASGLARCITGLTRNANLAKDVDLILSPVGDAGATGQPVLKLSARIGTKPDGTKCGGHNNAAGVRIYFDSTARPSRLDVSGGGPPTPTPTATPPPTATPTPMPPTGTPTTAPTLTLTPVPTPGTGDELADGQTLAGLDGVLLGAPQGTLEAPIRIEVSETGPLDVSLPGGAIPRGKFYNVRADQRAYAPNHSTFILGLPVPAGVEPYSLAVAEYNVEHGMWVPHLGVHDEQEDLILVSFPTFTGGDQVVVLMEHPQLSSPPNERQASAAGGHTQVSLTQSGPVEFSVVCLMDEPEIVEDYCVEFEALRISEAMQGGEIAVPGIGIYHEFTAMGFTAEPRLERLIDHVELAPIAPSMLDNYVIIKEDKGDQRCQSENSSEQLYGVYVMAARQIFLCDLIPGDFSASSVMYAVLRHEYFHAVQFASGPAFLDKVNGVGRAWIIEATASAAEESDLGIMYRSQLFDILRTADTQIGIEGADGYYSQDFWVFYARSIAGGGLGILAGLFEHGAEARDVRSWLGEDGLRSAYFRWARNQAMAEEELFDGALGPQCTFQAATVSEPMVHSFIDDAHSYLGVLGPLDSEVVRLDVFFLLPGESATLSVTNPERLDPDPDLQVKFFVDGEAGCASVPGGPRTITFEQAQQHVYAVVTNTDIEAVKSFHLVATAP